MSTHNPVFVQGASLTPEGQQVVEHIKAAIAQQQKLYEDGHGIDAINAMAGHLKHFYVHVLQTGIMKEHEWANSYPNSMLAAYTTLKQIEEAASQKEQVEGTADKVTTLEAKLEALEAKLTEALAENAALKEDKDDDDKPASKAKSRSKSTKKKPDETEGEGQNDPEETDSEGDAEDTND